VATEAAWLNGDPLEKETIKKKKKKEKMKERLDTHRPSHGRTYQAVGPSRDRFDFTMLRFDDERWKKFLGGYRAVFDPRPALQNLASNVDVKEAWHELWEGLHHQGDVGEASYAAVPHIVRIHRERGVDDWNTYALVAVIELARAKGKNPEVPSWLREEYFGAIQELATLGSVEVMRARNPEDIRAILSILAIAKNARTHARFLLEYSEEELIDLERQAQEADS